MQRDVEVVINIYMYCLGKCVWLPGTASLGL